ncbi:flagellar hook-basal body complex protein FliE [Motilimonas cestriensis]|uniref:Flagellar hook-basal body complex protein FliE n=1 Tax=Motilimonas cestriensis TaxID=2742685 RepID=A0ABS8WHK0_9GAMM|nr:flagellar hook-basal body complex protein FliE [Motilimonas cestriensis]MCE2597116.1 flagellar hook-basal body complex protein FliE [Motilimonas cestriensis]
MSVESILAVNNLNLLDTEASSGSKIWVENNSFSQKLSSIDSDISAMARGDKIEVHELMLDIESAKMTLEMSVAVRDKLIEAYKEISRMQV